MQVDSDVVVRRGGAPVCVGISGGGALLCESVLGGRVGGWVDEWAWNVLRLLTSARSDAEIGGCSCAHRTGDGGNETDEIDDAEGEEEDAGDERSEQIDRAGQKYDLAREGRRGRVWGLVVRCCAVVLCSVVRAAW